MNDEDINQIAMNIARQQRIDADDRSLRIAVDLELARKRIAELEALIAKSNGVRQKTEQET